FELPKPNAIPVAASAIGTNQHSLCLRIQGMPHLSPPAANALHGKTGRVMRAAYGHPPQVEFRMGPIPKSGDAAKSTGVRYAKGRRPNNTGDWQLGKSPLWKCFWSRKSKWAGTRKR